MPPSAAGPRPLSAGSASTPTAAPTLCPTSAWPQAPGRSDLGDDGQRAEWITTCLEELHGWLENLRVNNRATKARAGH